MSDSKYYVEISRADYMKHKPCTTAFFDSHCDSDDVLRIPNEGLDHYLESVAQLSPTVLFWFVTRKIIPLSLREAKEIVHAVKAHHRAIMASLTSAEPAPVEESTTKVYSEGHGGYVEPEEVHVATPPTEPPPPVIAPPEPEPEPEAPQGEYDHATGSYK